MRSASSRRACRPGKLDGLKVKFTDGPALSDLELVRALKFLAKLMLRVANDAERDQMAISAVSSPTSALTVSPKPRPDHSDEAA